MPFMENLATPLEETIRGEIIAFKDPDILTESRAKICSTLIKCFTELHHLEIAIKLAFKKLGEDHEKITSTRDMATLRTDIMATFDKVQAAHEAAIDRSSGTQLERDGDFPLFRSMAFSSPP